MFKLGSAAFGSEPVSGLIKSLWLLKRLCPSRYIELFVVVIIPTPSEAISVVDEIAKDFLPTVFVIYKLVDEEIP